MKKLLRFARSMRFGLLLLFPVLVCTVIGSLIPQGESESVYTSMYPNAYHLILGLGLNRVFSTPVFLLLTVLFGINLTLCSVSQLRSIPGRIESAVRRASESEDRIPLAQGKAAVLSAWLKKHGWREAAGNNSVFVSFSGGWYGSVITHFALLGVLLGAAGAFGLSRVADYPIMPGDNEIPGGIHIRLDDFIARDENDRIEYASTLEITEASGRCSGVQTVRVNHPLRFGANKYYQQSYGAAGKLRVRVKETGKEYPLYMTEQGMISIGGADGIWYDSVYPGYVEDGEGNITFIPQTTGEYPDPVYYIITVRSGVMSPMIAFPGEYTETEDATYFFDAPVLYPEIRVKTTPAWVYGILYASFALLVAGLWFCFFAPAAAVSVFEDGYAIVSRKSDSELKQRFTVILSEE